MPSLDISDAISWFRWDWDWPSFWAQLIAGLITFALGLFGAWIFFVRELQAGKREEFERFRNVAREVRADLADARAALTKWSERVASEQPIDRIDQIPMTWELAKSEITFMFAIRRLQRDTYKSVTWYKRSVEIALQWNQELASHGLTEQTIATTTYRIHGAIAQLSYTIDRLTQSGKLSPLPPYNPYPTLTPES